MPDLETKIRSLKSTWVVRALEIEGNWKFAIVNILPHQELNYFMRNNVKFGDIAIAVERNNICGKG